MKKLITKLKESDITKQVCKEFTYEWQGEHSFQPHHIPKEYLPTDFNIGFITGTSGSGKSILLSEFGDEGSISWKQDESVCSHFKSYKDAVDRLQGVGFNSIPMWLAPRKILSTGQGYRVDLARAIKPGMVRDEFTSFIDRSTAMGLCNSIQRYIRSNDIKNVVFAGVHKDIIPYLKPDWVYNTDDSTLTVNGKIYDVEDMQEVKFIKKPHFMEIS
jgi:hypothetical protein